MTRLGNLISAVSSLQSYILEEEKGFQNIRAVEWRRRKANDDSVCRTTCFSEYIVM